MGPRLFLQDAPPAPPPETPRAPTIDIGGLVEGIVNGFREVLLGWTNTLPEQTAHNAEPFIRDTWNQFWFSGINIFGTPLDLTRDFGPAQLLGRELRTLVPAIAALAVALLAMRIAWRVVSGSGGDQMDAANSVLFGIFLASISTTVVTLAFTLAVATTQVIGNINYAPEMFQPQAFSNFVFWVLTLLIMMWYGWKLFIRAAYRLVLLMFLAPWAPVASILWAIPQTRKFATLYWVNLGGWLIGGILAVGALSLGLQLATIGNTNPMVSLVFSVALVNLAHDLMGWLPSAFTNATGGFASIPVGNPSVPGAAAAGAGVAVAASGGFAGAMPAVAGALPPGEISGLGY